MTNVPVLGNRFQSTYIWQITKSGAIEGDEAAIAIHLSRDTESNDQQRK